MNEYLKHPSYPWLRTRTILLVKAGSHAYGLNQPGSDLDVRGVAIAPMDHYLGFSKTFEQAETKGDPDIVIYDIRKFFRLAARANPNILEMLFAGKSNVMSQNEWGRLIYKHRYDFLSKKVATTYLGYANQVMGRIKKCGPNEPYDTKDAMHLIRLLIMGEEILGGNGVQVYRYDSEELLEILNGKWKYHEILSYTTEIEGSIKTLRSSSPLPDEPDYDKLNKLLVDIIQNFK